MGQGTWPRSGPKAGAAEGEAGGRKGEKQETGREKKGPDAEAQAWGEGGMAEKGGGHMKCFAGTRFHLPAVLLPLCQGA